MLCLRATVLPRLLALACAAAVLAPRAHARASPMDDPDTEISRRHFERGAALYAQSRYAEAVSELLAARRVKSLPALDYNIARCYDRLENAPAAIDYYQRYLASGPAPGLDGGAQERLRVLRARLGGAYAREPDPPPRAAPTAPLSVAHEAAARPAETTRIPLVAPAAVAGVAAVSLVVGGALYGVSGSRYDDLVARGCGTTQACDDTVFGATRSMERAGIALLVTGAVISAVDVGLWAGFHFTRTPRAAGRR